MIAGLDLGPGDEILTSDEEHPACSARSRARASCTGVTVRMVPLRNRRRGGRAHAARRLLARRLDERALAPAALAQVQVPVLLDGAQGVGAIPVDVHALGCDAYAGAGQKWMCGPDGTGMLYVSPACAAPTGRTPRLCQPHRAERRTGRTAHEDARAFDTMSLSAEGLACALAAARAAGGRGLGGGARAGARRSPRGSSSCWRSAGARWRRAGPSTLVSFDSPDPERERERLARARGDRA